MADQDEYRELARRRKTQPEASKEQIEDTEEQAPKRRKYSNK